MNQWRETQSGLVPQANIRLGDTVQAREKLLDEGALSTKRGGVGDVLEVHPDGWATIRWQATGRVLTCHPSEFDVLCGMDFATRLETTPKERMVRFGRGARGTPIPFTPFPVRKKG